MLYSMTGYGRSTRLVSNREITVELRSVNHRYLELMVKVPRAYSWLEQVVKEEVQQSIQRGKVEVSVSVTDRGEQQEQVAANLSVARGYADAIKQISEQLGVENDITASTLARFPDVFSVEKAEQDEQELAAEVIAVTKEAVERFTQMRADEGESLVRDIASRLDTVEGIVADAEQLAAQSQKTYYDKLYAKLTEVLQDRSIDESRVLQEAAIFADKAAVDEETVRLRSHISQMRGFLRATGTIGKKMDFLVQEFNREANTIGSKANNLELTKLVVELKSEIEKIREQIQNIE